jgi:hypothetical protein
MTKDKKPIADDGIIDLNPEQVIDLNDPPKAAPPQPSRRRNWFYSGVALLAAATAGGLIYKDMLSAYFPSDQVLALSDKVAILDASTGSVREQVTSVERLATQLKGDVDSLESSNANLASQIAETQTAQSSALTRMGDVESKILAAQTALDNLAKQPVASPSGSVASGADVALIAALQQRIDALEKDVASLKADPVAGTSDVSQLSQSLADLKAKVAAGTGYGTELERIQRMVPAAAGLDVLAVHAATGIADSKGLATELKALIPDLPKPIIPGPVAESEGWWAGLYRGLSDLITIRVEGDVDWPTAASAAVALAESGDLPQALEQLNAIEAAKPVGLQQWADKATARLQVEAALKTVDEAVLRVIAAKG